MDCGLKINRLDVRENFLRSIIMDDQLGAQSLNQRQNEAPMNWRDHVNPISRKARQIERRANEHALQAAFFCILKKHLGIREARRAADLDQLSYAFIRFERGDEIRNTSRIAIGWAVEKNQAGQTRIGSRSDK